ncbi:hypothetical protein HDU82_001653 [Entophlyctis luteolus]|nr:hypothetical protein HDU82_001653 [Entophlyctis luteolus]
MNTASVTPIMSFKNSTGATAVAACVYNFTSNRQQLSFFFQTATWDGALASNTPSTAVASVSSYVNAVWISWASKGVHAVTPVVIPPVVTHSATVQTRGLVLSPGDGSEEYPVQIFQAYGLNYDVLVISNTTMLQTSLPLEVVSNSSGKYSVIVLSSGQMIAGFSNGSYLSTLYSWQWQQLYNYQQYYGVRLVAINDIPTVQAYAGQVTAANSATTCDPKTTLSVSPVGTTFTLPAGMKSGWSSVAGDGIENSSCNFPATITNTTSTTAVLNFVSGSSTVGVAAAVIDFGRNQQQMSLFMPCGSWSITCCLISHLWFQWATRGLYTGLRRLYFTPQVDDFFLTTDGLNENNTLVSFRLTTADMGGLIKWMPSFNSRMPTGSNVTFELAFNGNGVMEIISTAVDYTLDFDPDLTDTALDWIKPLGTGLTLWPSLSTLKTNWGPALTADPLYQYFAPANSATTTSKFLWVSHTFTHEILNNNTYNDTNNEVTFNYRLASSAFMKLDGHAYWSNKSMVTPGISGLFNGDALRALSDFGIKAAVGDSSRNKTMNSMRPLYWPMVTTLANNGFDGFVVIPRQSLNIYFNATNRNYNTLLYDTIYKTSASFSYIMNTEVQRNMRTLSLLAWYPAMFHQSNLRNADLPPITVGSNTGQFGLAQEWIESVFGNFTQFVNWPIVTVKQDDLTQKFINRHIYETANVTVAQNVVVSASGVVLNGFSVTANTSCIAPITVPYGVPSSNVTLPTGATTEQLGTDSLTLWVPLSAKSAAVSVTFTTPVTL